MLLEIINREGDRVEWTENERCIPSKNVFLSRMKDGYKFKLNGKTVKTYEVLEEAVNNKKR